MLKGERVRNELQSNVPPLQVADVKPITLSEIGRTFLMLGLLGFGGPAAHIALMEQELVTRRGWLRREYFLDLLAAINLVPGPTSTEMAFQIGYATGGFWGAVLSGAGFIVPAVIFSVALAMLYTAAGTLPAVRGLFLGVQPVILVLILSAAYRLGQKVIDSPLMRVLLAATLIFVGVGNKAVMTLFGLTPIYIPELVLLLSTGALYVLFRQRRTVVLLLAPVAPGLSAFGQVLTDNSTGLFDLFWRFLVIGGTLFGSGYILAAYLQRTFVDGLHWLSAQQLLEVLAIGQSTPGPVLSTASAAGYVMTVTPGNLWSGVPGAVAATVGVFLPAFVIVLILGRVVPYLRRYPTVLDFLKGVNAGVIALLIGAFVTLAAAALVRPDASIDWLTLLLAILAFVALERYHWSPLRLIIVGILTGVVRVALGW